MPYERAAGGYMAARKASKKVINFFVVGLTYGCLSEWQEKFGSKTRFFFSFRSCLSLQSLIIRRNTLFKLPWCCTPPKRFIKMKFWYPSTVTLLCIPPNSCISFSNRKAFFTSSVIGMQDIKLRQSPIGCWKMEFNHFFRIPVPRPKKAFSENTNSHMMNTMIVIYVREHIY